MSSGSSVDFNADAPRSESTIGSGTTAFVAGDMVTPGHTALHADVPRAEQLRHRRVWRMTIHFVIP